MVKIAINGFGRIGRLALRRILEHHQNLEVAAINDLMDIETAAYLFRSDTVYGRFRGEVLAQGGEGKTAGKLLINEKKISFYNGTDPLNLPWDELGVQIVIEATGRFTRIKEAQKHLQAGAKKVIISANSLDADISLVMGVNEGAYRPLEHQVIAACSCTTNCAAPVLKVLNDNFGIEKVIMTTVHALTATQSLVDGAKKDLREGRAALGNIIPSATGASEAVSRVLPQLQGRVSGSAFRVPVLAGSILEIVAQTQRETTTEETRIVFERAAAHEMKEVVAAAKEALVSADIVGRPEAAIVDLALIEVINFPQSKDKNLVKVAAWYDNEFGYACRLAELTEFIGKK